MKENIKYLKEKITSVIENRKIIYILLLGLIASIIILITTFSFTLSAIVLIISIATAILSESFSKGWLFLLAVAFLFPLIKITPDIYLFQIIIVTLIILGFIQSLYEKIHFEIGKVSFCFFLFFLVGLSLEGMSYISKGIPSGQIMEITINFLLIWLLLINFQCFFHTQKRIKRFIVMLIIIGCLHSVIGLLALFNGWHNTLGIGVSYLTNGQIFLKELGQLNGLWGNAMNDKIGGNLIVSFLSITILLTISFLIITYKNKFSLIGKKRFILPLIIFALAIQILAFLMTQAFFAFIFLGLGVLVMGILLKNNRLIILATAWTMIFSLMISKFNLQYKFDFEWINNFKNFYSWLIGNGIGISGHYQIIQENIHNSYLFVLSFYGIFGILILLFLFYYFLMAIYNNFKVISGESRIILITISVVFFCIILLSFDGNILLFGPTAIVFWLFYGVAVNFRKNALENTLFKKEIFYKLLRRHTKYAKSIDSVKKPIG